MNSGVGPGTVTLATVEVLDQSGEGVQFRRCGVPPNKEFPGVGLEMQREHLLLVLHVHLNLVCRLCVSDSEGAADFHLGSIFRSRSKQGSDDTLLVGVATEGMVQDGEKRLSSLAMFPLRRRPRPHCDDHHQHT